jgi:hypothetical protein
VYWTGLKATGALFSQGFEEGKSIRHNLKQFAYVFDTSIKCNCPKSTNHPQHWTSKHGVPGEQLGWECYLENSNLNGVKFIDRDMVVQEGDQRSLEKQTKKHEQNILKKTERGEGNN